MMEALSEDNRRVGGLKAAVTKRGRQLVKDLRCQFFHKYTEVVLKADTVHAMRKLIALLERDLGK